MIAHDEQDKSSSCRSTNDREGDSIITDIAGCIDKNDVAKNFDAEGSSNDMVILL